MNTKKWKLDVDHSELLFKVKHMMVSNVTGNVNRFDIDVETSGDSIENAHIRLVAEADSITTRNEKRDAHLKSEDFFDSANHEQIIFESTSFKKKNEEGDYELKGNLTIRGVSKPVSLNVELGGMAKDPWGNTKAGFSVSGKFNRKDWGLNYNAALETGGVMVSDEVRVIAEVQLARIEEKSALEA